MAVSGLDSYSAKEYKKIAEYNDALRKDGVGGFIFQSDEILCRPLGFQRRLMAAIRDDSNLGENNKARDTGALNVGKTRFRWQIDYKNKVDFALKANPLDRINTWRIMTIGKVFSSKENSEYEFLMRYVDMREIETPDGALQIRIPLDMLEIKVLRRGASNVDLRSRISELLKPD